MSATSGASRNTRPVGASICHTYQGRFSWYRYFATSAGFVTARFMKPPGPPNGMRHEFSVGTPIRDLMITFVANNAHNIDVPATMNPSLRLRRHATHNASGT